MATVKFTGLDFHDQFQPKQLKLQFISHRYTLHDKESEIFAAKFSPDQSYLAISYADGSMAVHSCIHGDKLYSMKDPEINYPIGALSWKPTSIMSNEAQVFKAVGADGRIIMWRPKYNNNLKTLLVSETNSYQCMDYSPDNGSKFAAAGKLPILDIYDDESLKKVMEFKTIGAVGHTNRIFCVKFDPLNSNVVYSGGWDRMVNIWDIRSGKCSGTIYGPQICGEAIDLKSNEQILLTGSHQVKEGLQLWDLRKLEVLKKIPWNSKSDECSQLYSAKFANPKKDFIIAGGSDKNSAKIFSFETLETIASFDSIPKACLVTDTSPEGNLALMGCADGSVHVKNLLYA